MYTTHTYLTLTPPFEFLFSFFCLLSFLLCKYLPHHHHIYIYIYIYKHSQTVYISTPSTHITQQIACTTYTRNLLSTQHPISTSNIAQIHNLTDFRSHRLPTNKIKSIYPKWYYP